MDALMSMISSKFVGVETKKVSVISSEKRLSIAFHLLNRPCSSPSSIASELSMSVSYARHLLKVLKDAEILENPLKGKYCVAGAVLPEHIDLFSALNNEIEREITGLIVHRGPLEIEDLMRVMKMSKSNLRYHLKKLRSAGILEKVGRIYEIGLDIMEFQSTYEKLTENAIVRIAMEAKQGGFSLDIDRISNGFRVRVSAPKKMDFEVYEVPFYDVLG
jgi:DNA-binding transcriptional ArsR family regulator